MTAHALDTLAIAGKLKAAGFSDAQAEAMTFVLRDASDAGMSGAATKADVLALATEAQIGRTEGKTEVQNLRAEMMTEFQSVRAEIQSLRIESKNDAQALGVRMQADIHDGKADTIKWVISAIGFQTIVLVGAVVALSRLFQP